MDGGYDALAEQLELSSHKGSQAIRDIIEAEHSVNIPVPPDNTYTRLLIRTFRAGRGRRRAHLEIVLGTALLPNYVHELKAAGLTGRQIRLVPMLPLPLMIGRPNEHGAQAALSMLIVSHLRDNARELAQKGSVELSAETMARLAERAGLPRAFDLVRLLDMWSQSGTDELAFLRRTEKDRYTLAEQHRAALDFMVEGGEREIGSSHRGKAAARLRNAAARKSLT